VRLAGRIPVQQARRALGTAFGAAGLDTPDLDARVLVAHALRLDHAGLVAAGARALDHTEAAEIASLADRRLAGEPVARILGTREFWGLPLAVTPAVLVPRPETETVVELALSLIEDRARPLRLADLGTGSGAILLALLHELPNAFGIGTDIAPGALWVARRNAMQLGLADRARFVACDYGAALAGPFDLVVSNPPYIATAVIATLAPEVRDHDPLCALDGGADGLAAYRALAADAARLVGAGHLVVEIGAGQARDVEFLLTQKDLALAAMRHDLSGIERALAARPA
jgi:release factor glutamine methyltransferase